VRAQFTGGGSTNSTTRSANGTYTEYIVAGASHTKFRLQGLGGGFTGKIDNVSVKQVDPNDRWTVTNADSNNFVEFTQGQARLKFLNTSPITQLAATAPYKGGKTYKLIVDVASVTSGSIKVDASGISELFNTAGVTTRIVSPTGNGNIHFYRASSNVDMTLNSVSLVEVQGDRPRLSYDITNGVVEDKPHLILEPSATNLVKFSENFSQWTLGSNSILTFESDIEAPDGTLGVYRLKLPATGSTYIQSNSFSSSNPLSVSIYAKATGTGNDNFNLYTGGSNISPLKTATDKWQRFEYTASGTDFFLINSGDSFITDIYIWGAQAEALSYATSIIPTAGTTITRAAETCNNSKPSVNSTEGVLYCEIAALVDGSNKGNRGIAISDGTSSQRVLMRFNNAEGVIQVFTTVGTTQGNMSHNVGDTKDYHKVAMKYKENDFSMFVDGTKVNTDTTGSVSSAGTLNVINFDEGFGSNDFYGKVKGLAVYNEALSESQLMQLTGVTASSIYNNFVTRTASFTVEALNEVKKVIDNL
jgi:hypothetical protein